MSFLSAFSFIFSQKIVLWLRVIFFRALNIKKESLDWVPCQIEEISAFMAFAVFERVFFFHFLRLAE